MRFTPEAPYSRAHQLEHHNVFSWTESRARDWQREHPEPAAANDPPPISAKVASDAAAPAKPAIAVPVEAVPKGAPVDRPDPESNGDSTHESLLVGSL